MTGFDEGAHPRDAHGKWTNGGAYDKLTVNSILNGPQVAKANSRTNIEIARDLNMRGMLALRELGIESGKVETPEKGEAPDAKAENIISSAIASEVEDEIQRSGKNATDWYTQKFSEAMAVAAVMHPEIATDPAAKFAYRAALAITSQGETVPSNSRLGEGVYAKYASTGRFPTDVGAAQQAYMNGNFQKLNDLIDKMGVGKTQEFLDKEFKVSDLEKAGYQISGENKDTMVNGSAILGPKIGQGFYQNLGGNYKPLTADMWMMRTWGRLTGTLTGQVPEGPRIDRFKAALVADGEKVPGTRAAILARADEVNAAHEKNYRDNRDKFNSGEIKKSETVYAAKALNDAVNGIKDTPSSGGGRDQMRRVVGEAQAKLAEAGHKMTVADLQATIWYPEKRLYSKMGGRASERINTDYKSELTKIAKKKGFTDEQINAGVKA